MFQTKKIRGAISVIQLRFPSTFKMHGPFAIRPKKITQLKFSRAWAIVQVKYSKQSAELS